MQNILCGSGRAVGDVRCVRVRCTYSALKYKSIQYICSRLLDCCRCRIVGKKRIFRKPFKCEIDSSDLVQISVRCTRICCGLLRKNWRTKNVEIKKKRNTMGQRHIPRHGDECVNANATQNGVPCTKAVGGEQQGDGARFPLDGIFTPCIFIVANRVKEKQKSNAKH